MLVMDRKQLQEMYFIWMVQALQKHEGQMFLFLCADAISRREQLTGGIDDAEIHMSCKYTGATLCKHL